MARTLLTLHKDVRDAIWRDYLGEQSISIKLLKCTSRALYRELQSFSPFVLPTQLDGCSLATIESVLPRVEEDSVDLHHWLGLLCNAAEAGHLADVVSLVRMDSFTSQFGRFATSVSDVAQQNLPLPSMLQRVRKAFYNVHSKIVKTRDWKTWDVIYDALKSDALKHMLLAMCFVDRSSIHGGGERLLDLSDAFCRGTSDATRGIDYRGRPIKAPDHSASQQRGLHTNDQHDITSALSNPGGTTTIWYNAASASLPMIGCVIGERGSVEDLIDMSTRMPEDLLPPLRTSCIRSALELGRFDGFMHYLVSVDQFNAITIALTYNNTRVLQFALQTSDVLLEADSVMWHAVCTGNAEACRLVAKINEDMVPGTTSVQLCRVLAMALLRSVDDARFFLDTYPEITGSIVPDRLGLGPLHHGADTTETSHRSFWRRTWRILLTLIGKHEIWLGHSSERALTMDHEKFVFFVCTVISDRNVDTSEMCRYMLKLLVGHVSCTEVLADVLLRLIRFDDDDMKLAFGKELALDALLDSTFEWVRFRFPGLKIEPCDATERISAYLTPAYLLPVRRLMDDSHIARFELNSGPHQDAKAGAIMRWIGLGGSPIPALSRSRMSVSLYLPLPVIDFLLQRYVGEVLSAASLQHLSLPVIELVLKRYSSESAPDISLSDSLLHAIAIHLFEHGQKRVFCKFYHRVFKPVSCLNDPVSGIVHGLPAALRTDSKGSNNRLRAWLREHEPCLFTPPQ